MDNKETLSEGVKWLEPAWFGPIKNSDQEIVEYSVSVKDGHFLSD
jgi:hypothetical protein